MGTPIALWEHQERSKRAAYQAISAGITRPLIVQPCGSGKTILAANIASDYVAQGKRVNFFANRDELITQAYNELTGYGLTVGRVQSDYPLELDKPVQIVSLPTLVSRPDLRPPADIHFADECHHVFKDGTYESVFDYYRGKVIIGLTATPTNGGGYALTFFEKIIAETSVKELIELGVLVPATIIAPKKPLGPGELAMSPLEAYQRYLMGRKTLVFAAHDAEAVHMEREFECAGISAAYVSYRNGDRKELIEAYRNGKIDVLINLQIATEGFNDRETSGLILARRVGSLPLYVQTSSRGMRSYPGKKDCVIVDLTGATHLHGSPDSDYEFSLVGRGMWAKGKLPTDRYCSTCGAWLPKIALASCPECGLDRSQELLRITHEKLHKFDFIRRRPEEERKAHYFKMLDTAAAKKHNPSSAYYRYKAAYGEDPKWGWKKEWDKKR